MKKLGLVIIVLMNFYQEGKAQDVGLVTMASPYSVKETTDRFAQVVSSKGLTVFARIDHAENATKQGLQLRPTELLIFGNPKAGTPLMQDNQIAGIDLPLKVLVWEDENGKVWLTYNDPEWIAERHRLTSKTKAPIQTMANGMRGFADVALKK